jgi:hypothetical protein
LEQQAPGGGEQEQAAEIVSVDHHFPAADTSSEVTNEGSGGRERVCGGVEAEARRARRAMASRLARLAALRGRAAGREDRAAVRIQAFYRGYLVRKSFVSPAYQTSSKCALHEDKNVYAKIEMHFLLNFRQFIGSFWKTKCVMAEPYATANKVVFHISSDPAHCVGNERLTSAKRSFLLPVKSSLLALFPC